MVTIWSHIFVAVAGGLSLYSFATEYLWQLSRNVSTLQKFIPFRPLSMLAPSHILDNGEKNVANDK